MSRKTFTAPAADAADLLRQFPIEEMKQRPQWVGFRLCPNPAGGKPKKIPVIAASGRAASNTKPANWGTFDAALSGLVKGQYTAAGYALAGDIVGVDLDGERWVQADGKLTAEGKEIVRKCDSYAEWSISRTGIHILMHGALSGPGRADHKVGIEIYSKARFFIVTGRQLEGMPSAIKANQGAIDDILARFFDSSANSLNPTERTETTEKTERTERMASVSSVDSVNSVNSTFSVGSGYSVLSVLSVDEVIERTLPTRQGERNGCLLSLARGMKFNAGMDNASNSELKPIVRRWHSRAFCLIGTKEFDETWSDFLRAWKSARIPLAQNIEGWALKRAESEPLPPAAGQYDSEPVRKLVGMCWYLSTLGIDGRFFLSCHRAGKLLGVTPDKALRWLKMLCADSVLQVIEPGNERRATRYRWIGKQET